MAGLAQTLQLTIPELADVAAMRLDVIDDDRRLDQTALQTELAERMRPQLPQPDACPAFR
jgi:hypothetical protein